MKWHAESSVIERLLKTESHLAHEDELVRRETAGAPGGAPFDPRQCIERMTDVDHVLLTELIDAISLPMCVMSVPDLSVVAANAAALVSGIFVQGARSGLQKPGVMVVARRAADLSCISLNLT